MKDDMLIYVMLLLMVLCMVGTGFASYDAPPQPKASPDLAEFIIQTPAEVYEKHGYSERTEIMFNLARFKELYIETAKQIQMLQVQVEKLEARCTLLEGTPVLVPDVNSIELSG